MGVEDDVHDNDNDTPGSALASDVMMRDIHGSMLQDLDDLDLSLEAYISHNNVRCRFHWLWECSVDSQQHRFILHCAISLATTWSFTHLLLPILMYY